MIISDEPIMNKNELIRILQKTDENNLIYIYNENTDEYYFIESIEIDSDGDLIIR